MASASLAAWIEGWNEGEAGGGEGAVWAPYRSYRNTWLRIAAAADQASARVTVEQIGQSVEGEPLWALDIAPIAAPGNLRPVFVMAGIHAMEHVGVATAVALIERAISANSVWRQRLIVVPMVNPDGFRAVERGLARGQRRFWRSNHRGVDLNRNFAAFWDDRYVWNRLARWIFSPGQAPLSEPESHAIDRLLARTRPGHAVSLHAFGEWIFTPYAGSRDVPPDAERIAEIAAGMAAAQPHKPYRFVQLARRSRLFQARGAEIDHFYREHGALSFLIEIGAGPRMSVPSTWTVPYRWFTPPASLLERDVENVVPAIEYLASC